MKSKSGGILKKGESYKCKRCGFDLQETKMLSMSTRRHDYGRQNNMDEDQSTSGYYDAYHDDVRINLK